MHMNSFLRFPRARSPEQNKDFKRQLELDVLVDRAAFYVGAVSVAFGLVSNSSDTVLLGGFVAGNGLWAKRRDSQALASFESTTPYSEPVED